MRFEGEKEIYLRRDQHDASAWFLETKGLGGYTICAYLHADSLWDMLGKDFSDYLTTDVKKGERISVKLTVEVED